MESRIFTLLPTQPFMQSVAHHVIKSFKNTPLSLANITIWVPSPRQAQALQKAFIQQSDQGIILPYILPLSAIEKAVYLEKTQPVISALARHMIMARQVQAKDSSLSPEQVTHQAAALSRLYEQLIHHDVSFYKVKNLVPSDFSIHWQESLAFLKIALNTYPQWLKEQNVQDEAHYKRLCLQKQAEIYRKNGFEYPVLAVGFSDTTAAGVEFLASILSQKNGQLILPALDLNMSEDTWKNIPPTHAQFGMKTLLKNLNISRAQVNLLEKEKPFKQKITLIEAPSSQREAEAIALVMRENLEKKNKTCALVSPDRLLAKRVKNALKMWQINVDDSAGYPLSKSPVGQLALNLLRAVTENISPLAVAAVVKHPFINCGEEHSWWKHQALQLEKYVLRGTDYGTGLQNLSKSIYKSKQIDKTFTKHLVSLFKPLNQTKMRTSTEWIKALKQSLNKAVSIEIWNQPDGEAFAALLENWQQEKDVSGQVSAHYFLATLQHFMEQKTLYSVNPKTPRVFIWGPLEARLQQVDCVIIAGMNEGTWPRAQNIDPWMNNAMKMQLGLPIPDHIIGLAAHDVFMLMHMPQVVMTRSINNIEGETVPSRFLQSWKVHYKNVEFSLKEGQKWLQLADNLRGEGTGGSVQIPQPNPPKSMRPTAWSASFIEKLMTCPYKAYAEKILHLKAFDVFHKPADAAARGTLIHECFYGFFKEQKGFPKPFKGSVTPQNKSQALKTLLAIGQAKFKLLPQDVKAVWWPRFEKIANAFIEEQVHLTAQGRKADSFEVKAKKEIDSINIHACADRIDKVKNGQIILDYKTGQAPKWFEVMHGEKPQLAIEAWLWEKENIVDLEIWQFTGSGHDVLQKSQASKDKNIKDITTITKITKQGLQKLVHTYQKENASYNAVPNTEKQCRYCEFSGICRYKEWAVAI